MKKIFLVISIISVLFLVGCNKNVVENDNNQVQEEQSNNQNEQEELISDAPILNMSFEERTKPFFDKKKEIIGDRLRRDFNNVRLIQKENYYELKADLIGDAKIDTMVLDNAINEIKENKLPYKEIELVNGEKVVIYSSRPQEHIDWYNDMISDGLDYDSSYGIGAYYDEDWILAYDRNEWLNEDGLPIYVLYNGKVYSNEWAHIIKENDGYYLYERGLAGRIDYHAVKATNEENAITITLFADDKIALDVNDFYGMFTEDYTSKMITVEEYYNLSLKDGTDNVIEDNLHINISNMSSANYYSIGLEVSDGVIHVIARNDGP